MPREKVRNSSIFLSISNVLSNSNLHKLTIPLLSLHKFFTLSLSISHVKNRERYYNLMPKAYCPSIVFVAVIIFQYELSF